MGMASPVGHLGPAVPDRPVGPQALGPYWELLDDQEVLRHAPRPAAPSPAGACSSRSGRRSGVPGGAAAPKGDPRSLSRTCRSRASGGRRGSKRARSGAGTWRSAPPASAAGRPGPSGGRPRCRRPSCRAPPGTGGRRRPAWRRRREPTSAGRSRSCAGARCASSATEVSPPGPRAARRSCGESSRREIQR